MDALDGIGDDRRMGTIARCAAVGLAVAALAASAQPTTSGRTEGARSEAPSKTPLFCYDTHPMGRSCNPDLDSCQQARLEDRAEMSLCYQAFRDRTGHVWFDTPPEFFPALPVDGGLIAFDEAWDAGTPYVDDGSDLVHDNPMNPTPARIDCATLVRPSGDTDLACDDRGRACAEGRLAAIETEAWVEVGPCFSRPVSRETRRAVSWTLWNDQTRPKPRATSNWYGSGTGGGGGPHCKVGCRCGNACIDCRKTCHK